MIQLSARRRIMAAGFLAAAVSAPGQTFFVSLYVPEISASLGLTPLSISLVYGVATLSGAALLPLLGLWARLLFWSGQSFEEPGLKSEGRFKAAEARYTSADQVDVADLERWLAKARDVQWDYKNLVRRKGRLERLL